MHIADFEVGIGLDLVKLEKDFAGIKTATIKMAYQNNLHRIYDVETPYLSDLIEIGMAIGKAIERFDGRFPIKMERLGEIYLQDVMPFHGNKEAIQQGIADGTLFAVKIIKSKPPSKFYDKDADGPYLQVREFSFFLPCKDQDGFSLKKTSANTDTLFERALRKKDEIELSTGRPLKYPNSPEDAYELAVVLHEQFGWIFNF